MARTVTLAQLVTRTRRLCSIESGSGANQYAAGEIEDYVNAALTECYEIMAAKWPERYMVETGVQTIANQGFLQLPANFLALVAIYYSLDAVPTDATPPIEMRPFQEREFVGAWSPNGWGVPRYQLGNGRIVFVPKPTAIHSVVLRYIPACPPLVLPADTFDGANGWDDYVTLRAAVRAAMKDETIDLGPLKMELAEARERLLTFASQRDRSQPRRIISARTERRRWWRR